MDKGPPQFPPAVRPATKRHTRKTVPVQVARKRATKIFVRSQPKPHIPYRRQNVRFLPTVIFPDDRLQIIGCNRPVHIPKRSRVRKAARSVRKELRDEKKLRTVQTRRDGRNNRTASDTTTARRATTTTPPVNDEGTPVRGRPLSYSNNPETIARGHSERRSRRHAATAATH